MGQPRYAGYKAISITVVAALVASQQCLADFPTSGEHRLNTIHEIEDDGLTIELQKPDVDSPLVYIQDVSSQALRTTPAAAPPPPPTPVASPVVHTPQAPQTPKMPHVPQLSQLPLLIPLPSLRETITGFIRDINNQIDLLQGLLEVILSQTDKLFSRAVMSLSVDEFETPGIDSLREMLEKIRLRLESTSEGINTLESRSHTLEPDTLRQFAVNFIKEIKVQEVVLEALWTSLRETQTKPWVSMANSEDQKEISISVNRAAEEYLVSVYNHLRVAGFDDDDISKFVPKIYGQLDDSEQGRNMGRKGHMGYQGSGYYGGAPMAYTSFMPYSYGYSSYPTMSSGNYGSYGRYPSAYGGCSGGHMGYGSMYPAHGYGFSPFRGLGPMTPATTTPVDPWFPPHMDSAFDRPTSFKPDTGMFSSSPLMMANAPNSYLGSSFPLEPSTTMPLATLRNLGETTFHHSPHGPMTVPSIFDTPVNSAAGTTFSPGTPHHHYGPHSTLGPHGPLHSLHTPTIYHT